MNRRRFLKESFCFSAALGLGPLAHSSALAQTPAEDPNGRYFLALGDFGSGHSKQATVAGAMKRFVEKAGSVPEGLWLLGDNFYSKMDGGVKSARWRTGFEEMYPVSHFPGPCRAVLGNHDYHDNRGGEKVQLRYAASNPGTRWALPAKWYRVDYPSAEAPLVTFLCLDSNLRSVFSGVERLNFGSTTWLSQEEEASQLAWFQAELAKPRTAPFLAVVAHHPLYSNGIHGDTRGLIDSWGKLLRENGVHFYFSGHDHDLQHLEFKGHPTSFVISGGGGADVRELKVGNRGPFSVGDVHGFSEWRISPEAFAVRHYDVAGALLHGFEKSPSGAIAML